MITITSGGTPVITKTSTSEVISFSSAPGTGATINLRTGEVLNAAQVDVSNLLAAGPLWFDLQPGANPLTVTGATASIDVQAAYNI